MTIEELFKKLNKESVIEHSFDRLLALEIHEARKLVKIYKDAFKDLISDLSRQEPGTMDEARLKATLAQVSSTLKIIEQIARGRTAKSTALLIRESARDTAGEINSLEKKFGELTTTIPVDAIMLAVKDSSFLINRYNASINVYNDTIRADIQRELTKSIVKRENYTAAKRGVARILGQWPGWKAARIARTELHNIYNSSKITAMVNTRDKYIPGLMKTVIIPMDNRTENDSKYLKKLNLIVPIEKPFKYKWDGKVREFVSPPDRPNDRSILVPVKKTWYKK